MVVLCQGRSMKVADSHMTLLFREECDGVTERAGLGVRSMVMYGGLSVVERHPGEGRGPWGGAPGTEVGLAEEPSFRFTAPVVLLFSLPGHGFEDFFPRKGEELAGLLH